MNNKVDLFTPLTNKMLVFGSKGRESKETLLKEGKSNDEIALIERPRICGLDLKPADFQLLEENRYHLFKGTLGAVIKVPNKQMHDSYPIEFKKGWPVNLHEFDIFIFDLNNVESRDYNHLEHTNPETKNNRLVRHTCSYPTTLFDPRPLASALIGETLSQINNRDFIQIVFACENFKYEYECVNVNSQYSQRLAPESLSIYSFLRGVHFGNSVTGSEMQVLDVQHDISSILKKYCGSATYKQTFVPPVQVSPEEGYFSEEAFVPLMKNINGEIISFLKHDSAAITFVFPDFENKGQFLCDFLQIVGPSVAPDLFPFSTQFKWKESEEYHLPNYSLLLAEKKKAKEDFKKIIEGIDDRIADNNVKFKYLHDMISESGDNLVQAIYNYLRWLEFENVKIMDESSTNILEEDICVELGNGLLIIETKGIGGTSTDNDCSQISKIKLRRSKERQKFDVFALYIVNHQRFKPPVSRKNPPFTDHQIQDAINDERGLLTTWQLFNLFHDIETGLISKAEAREQLLTIGLVEFRPRTEKKLPTPVEIYRDGLVVILQLEDIKLEVGMSVLAEKNGKFRRAKIISIQCNGVSVQQADKGEVGVMLDMKISKGTCLWI